MQSASLIFNPFFDGMLMVPADEFAQDTEVMADMVKNEKPVVCTGGIGRKKGKKTTAVVADTKDLWGMLHADDAGIVSHAPESLEKMASIFVRVACLCELMVSEPKTAIMCLLPKGTEECLLRRRVDCRLKAFFFAWRTTVPKRLLLGTMAGARGTGGEEGDWVSRLGEDLVTFGMEDEKGE
ncbi:unnamed protein product [Ectocarpus sp. CCAP 1310/34]|nr:unnamed protein product [Ectocarpus sp. CCAP 1310/34]